MLVAKWLAYFSLACGVCGACSVRADAGLEISHYTYGPPTRDGIGKFYMGREISHVMGHLGAGWLERPERERQERTDLLIAGLSLLDDFVVADIGAGTGYFTFPIAQRVPRGKVFSVDIQPEMLASIEQRKALENAVNVETVLGNENDPKLPDNEIDLAFIVDAYHEFSFPREMGERLKESLKPGGQLVLVEYRAEDPRVPIKRLHKMSEVQVKREMAAIGLDWVRTESYLPHQHVLIFQKSNAQP
ncbi:MAG: class I SAM-dependent methyltransferase [Pseudomonadota bacterium]|nr:class I SAM-dependent methyltransferase [Pseudomonadota bacterium]